MSGLPLMCDMHTLFRKIWLLVQLIEKLAVLTKISRSIIEQMLVAPSAVQSFFTMNVFHFVL